MAEAALDRNIWKHLTRGFGNFLSICSSPEIALKASFAPHKTQIDINSVLTQGWQ